LSTTQFAINEHKIKYWYKIPKKALGSALLYYKPESASHFA